jgi:hypothetical protein
MRRRRGMGEVERRGLWLVSGIWLRCGGVLVVGLKLRRGEDVSLFWTKSFNNAEMAEIESSGSVWIGKIRY